MQQKPTAPTIADRATSLRIWDRWGRIACSRWQGDGLIFSSDARPARDSARTVCASPETPATATSAISRISRSPSKPLAVGMENVPLAAGTSQFRRMAKRLERAGYVWTAGIINAALQGSSQVPPATCVRPLSTTMFVRPCFSRPRRTGGPANTSATASAVCEALTATASDCSAFQARWSRYASFSANAKMYSGTKGFRMSVRRWTVSRQSAPRRLTNWRTCRGRTRQSSCAG